MAIVERIRVHYRHEIEYGNDDTNIIGVTDDITGLRVVPVPGGDIAYVRKFGTPVSITGCTAISDLPAGQTMEVYALDGTLLGDKTGAGAFNVGGTVAAQGVYIELSGAATVVTSPESITLTGLGVHPLVMATETLGAAALRLYVSETTSTYYDAAMMYGGARHASALNDPDLPYFTITSAIAACADANDDGVEVLDSAIYDEKFTISHSIFSLYSTAGQTPVITSGIGARVSREVSAQWNNLTAVYFNEVNGNDANPGTWQEPFLTITAAIAGRGGLEVVYGGDGATAVLGTFDENGLVANAFLIEADYGYTPTINNTVGPATTAIEVSNAGVVRGITVSASLAADFDLVSAASVYDCTVENAPAAGFRFDAAAGVQLMQRCIVRNNTTGFFELDGSATAHIIECMIYNNAEYGILLADSSGNTLTVDINNCLIYDNGLINFYIQRTAGAFVVNGTIENLMIFNSGDDGFHITGNVAMGATLDNIIFKNNTGTGLVHDSNVTINYCSFDGNGTDVAGGGVLTNNNAITGNPDLCKVTAPYKLGLSSDSPCYRADAGGDNASPILRIIEINESTIEINGFYIDGQGQYNNAVYILDSDNHTALTMAWNDVYDFQGIAIDLYDDSANTSAILKNNRIYQNGDGVKFVWGGNTFTYNVVFNNAAFGVWSNYTTQTFTHNDFYGNKYGLYLESNSAGIIFIDNITNQNTSYGIYSEINVVATYCDITDATNNVDTSETIPPTRFNLTDNPMFINIDAGVENFRLKSIANGNVVNSPCIGAASDGTDIGAWQVDRSISESYWRLYNFSFQPAVTWDNIGKGAVQFNDATGGLDNWARAHKRMFTFDMSAPQVSNAVQRKIFEYWTTLIRKRESATVDSETIFRLHFLPTSYLETIANGTVDADGPTILDATQEWVYNEWKGFHVGVVYTEGAGTGTFAAIARTLTVAPAPGWTPDEWIGYYVYHFGYYYYILDNDADTLTLSDPLGTLENELTADWTIEKYFKIQSNNATTLCVLDFNGELISGTYRAYIDFIECKIQSVNFKYSQPRYLYGREHSKIGYSINFEEA